MFRENPKVSILKSYTFIVITVFLISLLIVGYYNIQITDSEKYLAVSKENIIREFDIQPTRGDVFDRNKSLLIDNRPAFSLFVNRDLYRRDTLLQKTLYEIVNDSTMDFKRLYNNKYAQTNEVLLKRHIDPRLMATLIENKNKLPGISIKNDPVRNFHHGINGAHVLGTLREISQRELETMDDHKAGDFIGYEGLEKFYNTALFGEKGTKSFVFDAKGNRVSEVNNDVAYDVPEIDGKDLYTSLDTRIQLVAESLLVGKKGAIVALDPRTGGIYAMASGPTYDPKVYNKPISNDLWQELNDPDQTPLLNRAIFGYYPPGSVYKMVVALTALNEKIITKDTEFFCGGTYRLGRRVIKCHASKGHGKTTLIKAIQLSCNIYFYQVGLLIGIDTWEEYSKAFQFGKRSGVDIPYEQPGLVPSREYYDKNVDGYTKGNLANLAIGQGELITTPLQIAQYTMILANKGHYYRPHFLQGTADKYSNKIDYLQYEEEEIPVTISDYNWNLVRTGMLNAVNAQYNTAWRAKLPDILVAGKTGTAQNETDKSHAWFTCFAPYENPEIVVSVIIERGGSGGYASAPIARSILEQYFYGKVKKHVYVKPKEDEIIPIKLPDIELPKIQKVNPFVREID